MGAEPSTPDSGPALPLRRASGLHWAFSSCPSWGGQLALPHRRSKNLATWPDLFSTDLTAGAAAVSPSSVTPGGSGTVRVRDLGLCRFDGRLPCWMMKQGESLA